MKRRNSLEKNYKEFQYIRGSFQSITIKHIAYSIKNEIDFIFYNIKKLIKKEYNLIENNNYISHVDIFLEKVRYFIGGVFSVDEIKFKSAISSQMDTGISCSEFRIPMPVIMYVFRSLKNEIALAIAKAHISSAEALDATRLVDRTLDIGLALVAAAYDDNERRNERGRNALRIRASSEDLAAERASQHAKLALWSQHLFWSAMLDQNLRDYTKLETSSFGIWIAHRASLLSDSTDVHLDIFDDVKECDEMLSQIKPGIRQERRHEILCFINSKIDMMHEKIDIFFENITDYNMISGDLEGIYHRRFINAAIGKEIDVYNGSGDNFCLISFTIIEGYQETYGSVNQARDAISAAALVTKKQCEHYDYVFRAAENKIMVLKVSTSLEGGAQFASDTSRLIEQTIRSTFGRNLEIKVAFIEYDGHPDSRHVIRQLNNAQVN